MLHVAWRNIYLCLRTSRNKNSAFVRYFLRFARSEPKQHSLIRHWFPFYHIAFQAFALHGRRILYSYWCRPNDSSNLWSANLQRLSSHRWSGSSCSPNSVVEKCSQKTNPRCQVQNVQRYSPFIIVLAAGHGQSGEWATEGATPLFHGDATVRTDGLDLCYVQMGWAPVATCTNKWMLCHHTVSVVERIKYIQIVSPTAWFAAGHRTI